MFICLINCPLNLVNRQVQWLKAALLQINLYVSILLTQFLLLDQILLEPKMWSSSSQPGELIIRQNEVVIQELGRRLPPSTPQLRVFLKHPFDKSFKDSLTPGTYPGRGVFLIICSYRMMGLLVSRRIWV